MTARRAFNRKHGHRHGPDGRKTPTYISWDSMLARCLRPSHPRFEDYGGRGVQVDPRWRGPGGFKHFLEDMGARPEGTSLDRIDVNGHYTKTNCRWATLRTQRWNRRDMAEPSERRDDVVEPLFQSVAPSAIRRVRWDENDEIPL